MNAWIQFTARAKDENEHGGIQIEGRIEKTSREWTIRGSVPSMEVTTTKEFTARGGSYGQKAGEVVRVKQTKCFGFEIPNDVNQRQVKFFGGNMFGGMSFEPWSRSFRTLDEALAEFRPGLVVLLETESGQLQPLTITHVDGCEMGWHHMHDLKTQRKMDRLQSESESLYESARSR